MSPAIFVCCLAVGAALLALWLLVRFPTLAPRNLRSAGFAVSVGFVLGELGGRAIPVLIGLGGGAVTVGIVMFLVVLPLITYVSLSALWFMRIAMGMMGLGGR